MKIFDQITMAEKKIKEELVANGMKYCVVNKLGLINRHKNDEYADAYSELILSGSFQYDCFARETVVFPCKVKAAAKILWNRLILWFQFGCD